MPVELHVDGQPVSVHDETLTLLDVLRDQLRIRSAKDGCAPQGQCGCCTVLVDGGPRVACVTPIRRVQGRQVTTLDGFEPAERARWADAFCATGASQCGFCTPGIIVRLAAEAAKAAPQPEQALLAHLCRCTGWRTIIDAFSVACGEPVAVAAPLGRRDVAAASRRAELEGHAPQQVGIDVVVGAAGFADDVAPAGALVAVSDLQGGWALGATVAEARRAAGKVQGRRSTVEHGPPLAVPDGTWARSLQTSWVDPAYVETDAAWCTPGGSAVGPLTNGGAFGGKLASPVGEVARRLADEQGRPVRVLWSREDAVRYGAKRPPMAAGLDPQSGRSAIQVARTPGIVDALRVGLGAFAERAAIVEVDVPGPPTSSSVRAAGWAEGVALRAALSGRCEPVQQPGGGVAEVTLASEGEERVVRVVVAAGDPLDEVVLRSYCIGAVHMALSWVTSERLTVAPDGTVEDLTVRSLGVLRALDMPPVQVMITPDPGPARPVSDAVFAATAAAVWAELGWPRMWPVAAAAATAGSLLRPAMR